MRTIMALAALAALSACRDAASESPVDLQPGAYDLSSTGIILQSGGERGQICLTAFEARDFAALPLRYAIGSWDGCSDTSEPRQGNAINGGRICKGARFRDDDESSYTYVAEISTDGFVLKGETRDKEDGSGPDTGPWRVVGRRTGDC